MSEHVSENVTASPDRLLDGLRAHFGFAEFRPLQREAIEHLLGGGDALVLMPTGGGKSLCYQLPALIDDGLTLIVSPLIALMQDQVRALRANGAPAAFLNSTLSSQEAFRVMMDVRQGETRLLYVAPERLNTDSFIGLLTANPPSLIAIDEAHCISQWGHQFRPDYRQLSQLTERFADVPVAALTATATSRVAADIVQQLRRPGMKTFRSGYNRPNLTYRVVPKRDSKRRLIQYLRQDPQAPTIIYSLRRADTETVAGQLQEAGIDALAYHAGLSAEERAEAQERFDSDEASVICATVAFGMGVDKPDVRRVVHLDMPESIETYYQETGRAGRDGDPAECLLFYTPGVWHQRRYFLDQLEDEDERERAFQRLRQMMNYCELKSCRRGVLLRYFGDDPPEGGCGACDNCLRGEDPTETEEESVSARRIVGPNIDRQRAAAENPTPTLSEMTEEERDLFERLREVRRELARAEGQPPYIVSSDRALRALARARPRSKQELLNVHGFGPTKVEQYGAALLAAVSGGAPPEPEQAEQPALAPQQPAAPPQPHSDEVVLESWEQTLKLWREGCSILAIAERRMQAPQTVLAHLQTAIRNGEAVDLSAELPSAGRLNEIRAALAVSENVGEAHERLGNRYSRFELRLVRVDQESRGGGNR